MYPMFPWNVKGLQSFPRLMAIWWDWRFRKANPGILSSVYATMVMIRFWNLTSIFFLSGFSLHFVKTKLKGEFLLFYFSLCLLLQRECRKIKWVIVPKGKAMNRYIFWLKKIEQNFCFLSDSIPNKLFLRQFKFYEICSVVFIKKEYAECQWIRTSYLSLYL